MLVLPNQCGCKVVHLCRNCAVHADDDPNRVQILSQSLCMWANLLSKMDSQDITSIELYDSCGLVVASVSGEDEPLILSVPPGELQNFLWKVRHFRIQTKSYFGKKYAGAVSSKCPPSTAPEPDTGAVCGPPGLDGQEEQSAATHDTGHEGKSSDDDWEFLQTQLHAVLNKMQEQALNIYGGFLDLDSETSDVSSMNLLPDDVKIKAIETVVEDTMSGLLSSMTSHKARKLVGQHTTGMRTVVQSRVGVMFASAEQDIAKARQRDKTSGITSRTFPSQMMVIPQK